MSELLGERYSIDVAPLDPGVPLEQWKWSRGNRLPLSDSEFFDLLPDASEGGGLLLTPDINSRYVSFAEIPHYETEDRLFVIGSPLRRSGIGFLPLPLFNPLPQPLCKSFVSKSYYKVILLARRVCPQADPNDGARRAFSKF